MPMFAVAGLSLKFNKISNFLPFNVSMGYVAAFSGHDRPCKVQRIYIFINFWLNCLSSAHAFR